MKKQFVAFGLVACITLTLSIFLGSIQQNLGEPGVLTGEGIIRDKHSNIILTNCVTLPQNVGLYTGVDHPVSTNTVDWLPPDTTYGFRRYSDVTGFEALTQVVLMGRDRTSIHKPEYCLYGSGWKIEKSEQTEITLQKPFPYRLPVTKVTISKEIKLPDDQVFQRVGYYYYWFVSEDQITATHMERISMMAKDLLQKRVLKRWAYVSFLASAQPGLEDKLDDKMIQLIQESVPHFQLTPPPENLRL